MPARRNFVADLTAPILAYEPDLVGFTSTFQQNMAALAVARSAGRSARADRYGRRNCDGAQGEALHRNFAFMNSSSGVRARPRSLTWCGRCARGRPGARAGAVLARAGRRVGVQPDEHPPLAPSAIVAPDYDGYFERLAGSVARDWVEPKLVVEGARGCWWGKKHAHSAGSTGRSWSSAARTRLRSGTRSSGSSAGTRCLTCTSSTTSWTWGSSPRSCRGSSSPDTTCGCCTRSSPTCAARSSKRWAPAGLVTVQPGVESLGARVLGLMNKGVTGYAERAHAADAGDAA